MGVAPATPQQAGQPPVVHAGGVIAQKVGPRNGWDLGLPRARSRPNAGAWPSSALAQRRTSTGTLLSVFVPLPSWPKPL
jgi:hypothetical protein